MKEVVFFFWRFYFVIVNWIMILCGKVYFIVICVRKIMDWKCYIWNVGKFFCIKILYFMIL